MSHYSKRWAFADSHNQAIMSLYSTTGNTINGVVGITAASLMSLSQDIGTVMGLIVTLITLFNAIMIAREKWRNRNQ